MCSCRGGSASAPDASWRWCHDPERVLAGLKEAGRLEGSLCTYTGLRGLEAGMQSLSV